MEAHGPESGALVKERLNDNTPTAVSDGEDASIKVPILI